MTFYQELQLNQAGSKSLLKNSKTMKEKTIPYVCIHGEDSCYDGFFALPLSLPQALYWERITVL